MNSKKLNETKIYDNLTQIEKAKLMFKAIKSRDDSTFDKLIGSGESQAWIIRNHGSNAMLEILTTVALSWGIAYWKNQSKMIGNLALTRSKECKNPEEALHGFKSLQILNKAYLVALDRLEADYGLDKDTVFNLVQIEDSYSDLIGEIDETVPPREKKLFNDTVDHIYRNHARLIDQVIETIGDD